MSKYRIKQKQMRWLILSGVVLILFSVIISRGHFHGVTQAQAIPGEYIVTHHETIPNPVYNSGFRVAVGCQSAECYWDNPSTWQTGTVPNSNSRVIVDGNVKIRNQNAVARSVGIYSGGKLTFASNVNTSLQTADLIVFDDGTLEIGTANGPIGSAYQAEVVFRDIPFDSNDSKQHLRGLLAFNGVVRVHGNQLDDAFLRTAIEPAQGSGQIRLTQSARSAGWRVGDPVVIPTSRQCPYADIAWLGYDCPDESEDRTIAGISADGFTITLNQALQFDHPGARDHAGSLDFLPHVINKSRNVVFRSENPYGVRGHLLFHGRADVDMRYATVKSLGRTDIRHLGATNEKGRYPVHAHHLIGPQSAQSNGYQFTLIGNVVDFGDENRDQDRKWGISIHGSHFGLIEQNVVDHAAGAAIVTESGSEMGNMFRENFVVRVIGGNGARTEDTDPNEGSKLGRSGTGFWFNGGGRNYIEGNVVAAVSDCDTYVESPTPDGSRPAYCYGYKFDNVRNGDLLFPVSQGSDPHHGGGETVSAYSIGINHFTDNEAYAVPNGITVWWECSFWIYPDDNCSSYLDSFTVWHFHRWGYFGYPVNNFTMDNFVMRGDPSLLTNRYATVTGLEFADYFHRNMVIRNADIQNVQVGINLPTFRDERGATGLDAGISIVEDSYLVATRGIGVWAPASVNGTEELPPQTAVLRNVRFGYPDVDLSGQEQAHIFMHDTGFFSHPPEVVDFTLRNDVWVYNYNRAPGVDGDDFYIIPDYQGRGRCDNSIGMCNSEITANFGEISKGHVYRLRNGEIPATSTPTPRPTQTPAPSGDTFNIYTDLLAQNWSTDWSWDTHDIDLYNQEEVADGTYSVKAHLRQWGGLTFRTESGNVNLSEYDLLRFDVKVGGVTNQPMMLRFNSNDSLQVDFNATSQWQTVELSLDGLSGVFNRLDMFSANENEVVFWVDNLRLVQAMSGGATSTPRPTQTPTPRPTQVPTQTSTPRPTQVPTQTPTPRPTQTPVPSGDTFNIYTDSMAQGWSENWSWSTYEVDINNSEEVASGSRAIKAHLRQWGGFGIGSSNSNIDVTDYSALQFDVKVRNGSRQFETRLMGDDNTQTGFEATSQWRTISVPLGGLSGTFYRLDILSANGNEAEFWVDNVRLVNESASAESIVENGTFDTTTDPWYGWSSNSSVQIALDNGELRMSHNNTAGTWSQLYQRIGQVTAGKTYRLRFDIRSNQNNAPVSLYIQQLYTPWNRISNRETINADRQAQFVEVLLTADTTEADPMIVFQLEDSTQTIWIDNVSLYEE